MSDARSITVKVLGRDYQVACPPDERDALYAAARYLDDRMIAIRKRAAGLGLERIAIMTALNMSRELMSYERQGALPAEPTAAQATGPEPASKPAKIQATPATNPEDADRIAQLSLTIKEALSDD